MKLAFKTTLLGLALALTASPLVASFAAQSLGARPQGMGGAFAAVADDAHAAYWNPAGLSQIDRPELTLMHARHEFISSLQTDFAALAGRAGDWGLGLAWHSDSAELVQGPYAQTSRFSEDSFLVSAAADFDLFAERGLSLGISAKRLALHSTALQGNSGLAFDAGLLLAPHRHFKLAVVGRNLAGDLAGEPLAPTLRFGVAVPLWQDRIVVAADLDSREHIEGIEGLSLRYHAGLEFRPVPMIALRGGHDFGDWTGGASLAYGGFSVDYAYRYSSFLGPSHRMALSLRVAPHAGDLEDLAAVGMRKEVQVPKGLGTRKRGDRLEITWARQPGQGIIGYNVYVKNLDDKWVRLNRRPVLNTRFRLPGRLKRGQAYQFAVRAVVRGGVESAMSKPIFIDGQD